MGVAFYMCCAGIELIRCNSPTEPNYLFGAGDRAELHFCPEGKN